MAPSADRLAACLRDVANRFPIRTKQKSWGNPKISQSVSDTVWGSFSGTGIWNLGCGANQGQKMVPTVQVGPRPVPLLRRESITPGTLDPSCLRYLIDAQDRLVLTRVEITVQQGKISGKR